MRLTLRTLLAYLDGLLDPKDTEELAKKIEESEYATTLVHRIRDAMRRLRLGAPSLTDRGPGLDANTVAEYLDNTLDSERVADFEKICLDSDVHLAEIASCHQILTLVLGEPADVDLASRQRMYQLQERPHAPPLPPPVEQPRLPEGVAAPQLDLGDLEPFGRKARPKPTVPEYLREPRRKPVWVSIAAAILLLLSITGIVLKSLGQFEPDAPIGKWLVSIGLITPAQTEEHAAVARSDETPKPATEKATTPDTVSPAIEPTQQEKQPAIEPPKGVSELTTKQPSKPETAAQATKPGTSEKATEAATAGQRTSPPTQPEPSAKPPVPAAPAPSSVAPTKDAPSPAAPPSAPTKEPAAPPVTPPQPPAVTPPATKEPTPVTPPATAAKEPPAKSPSAVPLIPAVEGQSEKPRDTTPATPANPQREALGRLMSSDQILLSRESAGEWTRVTPNQILFPRQVLVLPTYRARVALTVGTLDILAGTRLDVLGTSAPQPPGVRVLSGRVVLMPLAKPGAKLRLAFADRTGTISFVDADSVAALDVRRICPPGSNPETDSARITATLYAVSGAVLWEETVAKKQSEPVRLGALQRLSFDDQPSPAHTTARELPKWITAEPIKELDRRASVAIAQAMLAEKPNKAASVSLLEQAASRRQEVRWLALRSLGYLGQFAEMVAALDDPAHKLDWQDNYVDELRAAIRRDAETAAAVRTALERRYPQQGADLYRMLCGYSEKDLEDGEDAKLVRGLEDDLLAVRRLSYWNLRDITGLGLYYQPEQPPARRQVGVRAWRQRLDAKEIRPKNPEDRATPLPRPKSGNEKSATERSHRPPAAVPPREPDAGSPPN
ncbi:MAG: hypothetical protein LLG00_02540 [Planctomycetaceae bacterium]|nr:hypothetical protein [Planctomycetaceae bacterium]